MNYNEDELQKELKELKASVSLDTEKKESMKAAIRKHTRKKRQQRKLKQSAIWFSTTAALLICGILIFNTINHNQSVLPADDHNQSEHDETIGGEGKESADNREGEADDTTDSVDETQESQELTVSEHGTETQTIMVEGMEEKETLTNFTLEPYGIQYQMGEFLRNYDVDVDDGIVRHYSFADNASITLKVVENAALDDVVSDVQSEYNADASATEHPADTLPGEENPYQGVGQNYSDPPQGYYVYQVEENVLVIQYEYEIEVGDGIGPRLQVLRESIRK